MPSSVFSNSLCQTTFAVLRCWLVFLNDAGFFGQQVDSLSGWMCCVAWLFGQPRAMRMQLTRVRVAHSGHVARTLAHYVSGMPAGTISHMPLRAGTIIRCTGCACAGLTIVVLVVRGNNKSYDLLAVAGQNDQ
jgi:hypothetical protein